ncbi:MAG: alpha/beta hydrolase [Lachnospiraceae bacterium]|nr:alpha/beta hydrolase [Lachnospiraceae bacterium]
MALFTLNIFSKYLMGNTTVSVIMPRVSTEEEDPAAFYRSGQKYKVLWLLHGSCGDATDWIRNTNICRYAEARDLIVVTPSVLNSDYSNYVSFADGFRVWDYITKELMPLIHNWLPASDKKEDNFVGGMSMGGNGALMLALGHPELFGGAMILSSTAREIEYLRPYADMKAGEFREAAKDPVRFPGPNGTGMRPKEVNQVAKYDTVGDFLNSPENAWDRFTEAAQNGTLIPMYVSCGTKDKNVYPRFLRFREYAQKLGVTNMYFKEIEGFRHEYALWNTELECAMDYFGITACHDFC